MLSSLALATNQSEEGARYSRKHEPLLSNPAQMRSEGGRKDHCGLVFNARTLAESQIWGDFASRDDSGQHRPGPLNSGMGSIREVEGIGLWVFRQNSCDVSVHASTLRESHRRHLQTPG